MQWQKWPKIENLCNEREANSLSFQEAAQLNTKWAVTEKIDGTNIGLSITSTDFQLNSRNNILERDSDFYNIKNNISLFRPVIYLFQCLLHEAEKDGEDFEQFNLYGEYFGRNILNRIDYGVNYDVRFYAASLGVPGTEGFVYFTYREFQKTMFFLNLVKYTVPLLGIMDFNDAAKFPNDGPSQINSSVKMEGVVLYPTDIPFVSKDRKCKFIFKNKNSEFLEKTTRKAAYKDVDIDSVRRLKSLFDEYVTESRLYSVISKVYKPVSRTQYKDFAGPFIDDAWEDFRQDYGDAYAQVFMNKDAKKLITANAGGKGYALFKKIVERMNMEN